MADPFNLAALKTLCEYHRYRGVPPPLEAGDLVEDVEELRRHEEQFAASTRALAEASSPDQILALHARLLAFRSWLVTQHADAKLWGHAPVRDALEEALAEFDAAVSLPPQEE